MVTPEGIMEILMQFNFETISAEWFDFIWNGNFLETMPLSDYEFSTVMPLNRISTTLNKASSLLRSFSSSFRNENDDNFWQILIENNISLKNLLAFVFYLIQIGQETEADFDSQMRSLAAAEFYMAFTSVNGSRAYSVFHPALFQKTIEAFKLCCRLMSPDEIGDLTKKRQKSKNNRARPVNSNDDVEDDQEMADDDDNLNEGRRRSLNGREVDAVQTFLYNLLKGLWSFLGKFSMQNNDDSVFNLVDSLVELLNVTSEGQDTTLRADDDKSLRNRNVASLAFANLHKLCNGQHGSVDVVAKHILKRLMPILTMRSATAAANASTVPMKVIHMKDLATAYIHNLMFDQKDVVGPLVYILVQNLCAKTVDKAAFRSKCALSIADLASALPDEYFAKFADWLHKFSRHTKISYRAFAVDMALALLKKAIEIRRSLDDADQVVLETLKRDLVMIVVNRCNDKAASVRMRALSGVALLIADEEQIYLNVITSICIATMPTPQASTMPMPYNESAMPTTPRQSIATTVSLTVPPSTVGRQPRNSSFGTVHIRESSSVSLVETTTFVPMVIRRCSDEKASVRKIAVQTLETIVLAIPGALSDSLCDVLHNCCMDPALSVRKQAIETFTAILMQYDANDSLETKWLLAFLPTITDREVSVQEKSSELFVSAFFNHLTTNRSDDETEELLERKAWRLLAKIETERELSRYLLRFLHKLVAVNPVDGKILKAIEQKTKQANTEAAAWMILSELSGCSRYSPMYAQNVWLDGKLNSHVVNYVAKILANKADKLSVDDTSTLLVDMKRKIESFNVLPEHVASILQAISLLYRRFAEGGDADRLFQTWCNDTLTTCERYLSDIVFVQSTIDDDTMAFDSVSVVRRLITLGEIVLLSSRVATKRIFFILQALILSTTEKIDEIFSQPVQPERRKTALDEDIRAYALVVLGKLCLQDEESAKCCIAELARELETCESNRIRNNVIIVLADLCVRYTSLVDRHIGTISKCLRDRSQLVRKQTLTLLTTLLKEDYLKWRGVLFHRFLGSLLDSDVDIRTFTEFCLLNILLARHPLMFFNHFVECVFVFNDVKHPSCASSVDDDGGMNSGAGFETFKLSGDENKSRRLFLYKFMLERFNDQQRFQTSARIVQDILGAIVDEILPLDASTEQILCDALTILACKEMKLCSLRRPAAVDDADLDDPEPAVAGVEIAEIARKALSQAVKQSTIENIVPTVVSLKHVLAQKRHPLMRELMFYLRELVKDYKNEIHEIFAADHQLAVEVEYDLKRFENREKRV